MYGKSLEMRLEIYGNTPHPDIATSYNNMGITYKGMGDIDKARDLLQKALQMREQTLGQNHPDTISTRQTLSKLM